MSVIALLVLAQVNQAVLTPPPPPPSSPDARVQYGQAVNLIYAQRYREAVALLNEVVTQLPQWAEAYSARCTALLRLQRAGEALADCRYALARKPDLGPALLGLATAEAALGQSAAAMVHFRDYARLDSPDVTPELRARALAQAEQLQPMAQTPSMGPATSSMAPVRATAPSNDMRPTVMVNVGFSAGSSPRSTPGVSFCQSSLDCGHGAFCKDRGDGLKVCMGDGDHGDSCSSSIDCGSGAFCKDRGDGFKVCMSSGSEGQACSSSIDCGSGLFCREGPGGLKVCQ